MTIRLSDIGTLGATRSKKSPQAAVKARAAAAQRELDAALAAKKPTAAAALTTPAKVTAVMPPTAAAVVTPAAASAAAGSPLPEAVKAPSSGAAPTAPVTGEFIGQFERDIQFVEEGSLRAITQAAQKNEAVDIRIAFPGQPVAVRRLTAEQAKAVMSMAFNDIMRRASTRPDASSGTVTQSGDSGQKTKELAVPGAPAAPMITAAEAAAMNVRPSVAPSSAPILPADEGSDTKLWVGLGVGALVLVGALAWMKSKKNKQASLPEQVQGWFDAPKRKRRKNRR